MPTLKAPTSFCRFCGKPGVSKEHLIPKWVQRCIVQPLPMQITQKHRVQTTLRGPIMKLGPPLQGGPLSKLTIKKFCETCNNGWMSLLENSVKNVISPAIAGEPCGIAPSQFSILARWAIMRAMIEELLYPDTVVLSQEQRQAFMKSSALPDGWRVWVGRSVLQDVPAGYWQHPFIAIPFEGEPLQSKCQVSTITYGKLVLHFVSTEHGLALLKWSPETFGLARLWPPPATAIEIGKLAEIDRSRFEKLIDTYPAQKL